MGGARRKGWHLEGKGGTLEWLGLEVMGRGLNGMGGARGTWGKDGLWSGWGLEGWGGA